MTPGRKIAGTGHSIQGYCVDFELLFNLPVRYLYNYDGILTR